MLLNFRQIRHGSCEGAFWLGGEGGSDLAIAGDRAAHEIIMFLLEWKRCGERRTNIYLSVFCTFCLALFYIYIFVALVVVIISLMNWQTNLTNKSKKIYILPEFDVISHISGEKNLRL